MPTVRMSLPPICSTLAKTCSTRELGPGRGVVALFFADFAQGVVAGGLPALWGAPACQDIVRRRQALPFLVHRALGKAHKFIHNPYALVR
jgi:hypothetical protein